jgi:hypothetical protein
MKKFILGLVMLVGLGQSGCMFLGGAALGAAGTGGAYEYNAHEQMEKLEADYKAERISRAEYDARKKQIEAGSIIY